MPAEPAVVKKALSRDMVSAPKPAIRSGGKTVRGQWPADPYAADCPTRQVLDRIADKWTVLLLILLSQRPWRFNELRREIGGLTQKMASQTLKGLERDGLVKRKVTPTVPVRNMISALGPRRRIALRSIDSVSSTNVAGSR